jgi:hypothetical protein
MGHLWEKVAHAKLELATVQARNRQVHWYINNLGTLLLPIAPFGSKIATTCPFRGTIRMPQINAHCNPPYLWYQPMTIRIGLRVSLGAKTPRRVRALASPWHAIARP